MTLVQLDIGLFTAFADTAWHAPRRLLDEPRELPYTDMAYERKRAKFEVTAEGTLSLAEEVEWETLAKGTVVTHFALWLPGMEHRFDVGRFDQMIHVSWIDRFVLEKGSITREQPRMR